MSRMSVSLLALVAVLWWGAGYLRVAVPPEFVVIQAGPRGGSFDAHARHYAADMAAKGLRVLVRNQEDSRKIIDRVADPRAGVQVGFTAQRVDERLFPGVVSAGVVELQPLFLFLRRDLPRPATPAGLAGWRLALPPEGSATAQAALDLLNRYGLTRRGVDLRFLQMDEAAGTLQRGDVDAGFFMLAPGSALVRRLAADPRLVAYSYDDSPGITRNIDYLKPASLARGAFDLRGPVPSRDLQLVGANVDVVVREDIHPAALYALLEAMSQEHKAQTLVSAAGEYPRQSGTALPVHPLAEAWVKSGTPWLYAHLPGTLAGLVDACWGPALVLLTLVSVGGTIRSLGGFLDSLVLWAALRFLARTQRRLEQGRRPGPMGRRLFRLFEPVVIEHDRWQRARFRLEQVRPYFDSARTS